MIIWARPRTIAPTTAREGKPATERITVEPNTARPDAHFWAKTLSEKITPSSRRPVRSSVSSTTSASMEARSVGTAIRKVVLNTVSA